MSLEIYWMSLELTTGEYNGTMSETVLIQKSNRKSYFKNRRLEKKNQSELFRHEGLPSETFTEFQKRIKPDKLTPKLLRDAIILTKPDKKKDDILSWCIRLMQNYQDLKQK